MAYLNDAALWQAVQATMTNEQRKCLEALHDEQQRRKLTVSLFQGVIGITRIPLKVTAVLCLGA